MMRHETSPLPPEGEGTPSFPSPPAGEGRGEGDRSRIRVVILGAAGRDFHNFNVFFKRRPEYEVVAFTAAQIPGIAGRTYPPDLAGPLYPQGIPIHGEDEFPALIREHGVHRVVFAYSDVAHEDVMHAASKALAAGADFWILGPESTMLHARVPVISVCAVRTGAGKSPVTRYLLKALAQRNKKAVIVRHPMPYGDLSASRKVQRFAHIRDLDKAGLSIEEREEFEPVVSLGGVVMAGIDYEAVLAAAQEEGDTILWDGGNNDFSFFHPSLEIVVADPLRAGDETRFHPGEAALRRAHVVVVSKANTASAESMAAVEKTVRRVNPRAKIVRMNLAIRAPGIKKLKDKRALVVEDGPTLTHGGMAYGAGTIAARAAGAVIVDPRPYALGLIKQAFSACPYLGDVVPAIGYSPAQVEDLAASIRRTPCDAVVSATPVDLERIAKIDKPVIRVTYEAADAGRPTLAEALDAFLKDRRG